MRRAVQESQASGAPGAQRAGEAHGPVKYAPLNGKTRVHRRSVASGRSGRCARMGIGVQNGAGFRRSHGARNHAVTSHRARPADTERARCDTWTRNRTSRHPVDSRADATRVASAGQRPISAAAMVTLPPTWSHLHRASFQSPSLAADASRSIAPAP